MSPTPRPAARTVTIGGLPTHDDRAGKLVLPLLRGTEVVEVVTDALSDAVSRRTGIVVVGEKGVGKTEAARLAERGFEEGERQRQALDAGYRRRRVLKLPALVTPKYRDVQFELHKQIAGTEARPRVSGAPVSEDTMHQRLCTLCFDQNVAALIVDQAEGSSREALRVLRDFMTFAAELDERRTKVDGVFAAGVGVLLVGAPGLRAMIATDEEKGHRWARVAEVHAVAPEEVGAVYRAWMPRFEEEIARRGAAWWESELDGLVSKGQAVAIRSLWHHVSRYWDHVVANYPAVHAPQDAPLDYGLFRFAADETDWQRSTTRRA